METERSEREKREKERKEREEREKIEREMKEREERQRMDEEKRKKEKEKKERIEKEKEEKERKEKEKEKRRLEKEKKEKEKKEREEQEKLESERLEKENEEKRKLEIEKKKKEREEKEKKKKEKEKKEIQKLINSNKRIKEEELMIEEMKNEDKNKEKDFYKIYLNSLDRKPNTKFGQEFLMKNNDFQPIVYKHPENIYLKAVYEYKNNKEKLKNYNKKTGLFDLYLNKTRTNKFYINANKEENNIKDNNAKDNLNNKLRTSNNSVSPSKYNIGNKSTQYKKKHLLLNINRGNSTGNKNYLNSEYKKFLTSNSAFRKTNNSSSKFFNQTKNTNNEEATLDEMVNFVLEKETERKIQKKFNVSSNPINSRKAQEQKKQIVYSLNDPHNPYSALFYNNILGTNYNVGIHYKYYEQGVPHLRIKKLKKSSLPPVKKETNLNKERLFGKTYSSGFNFNKKKKLIILPSNSDLFNKSSSKKKKSNIDYGKKDIETKSLFLNNKDEKDNNELPRVNESNE